MTRSRRGLHIETPESHQRLSGDTAESETQTIRGTQTQTQSSKAPELAQVTEEQLDTRIRVAEQGR